MPDTHSISVSEVIQNLEQIHSLLLNRQLRLQQTASLNSSTIIFYRQLKQDEAAAAAAGNNEGDAIDDSNRDLSNNKNKNKTITLKQVTQQIRTFRTLQTNFVKSKQRYIDLTDAEKSNGSSNSPMLLFLKSLRLSQYGSDVYLAPMNADYSKYRCDRFTRIPPSTTPSLSTSTSTASKKTAKTKSKQSMQSSLSIYPTIQTLLTYLMKTLIPSNPIIIESGLPNNNGVESEAGFNEESFKVWYSMNKVLEVVTEVKVLRRVIEGVYREKVLFPIEVEVEEKEKVKVKVKELEGRGWELFNLGVQQRVDSVSDFKEGLPPPPISPIKSKTSSSLSPKSSPSPSPSPKEIQELPEFIKSLKTKPSTTPLSHTSLSLSRAIRNHIFDNIVLVLLSRIRTLKKDQTMSISTSASTSTSNVDEGGDKNEKEWIPILKLYKALYCICNTDLSTGLFSSRMKSKGSKGSGDLDVFKTEDKSRKKKGDKVKANADVKFNGRGKISEEERVVKDKGRGGGVFYTK